MQFKATHVVISGEMPEIAVTVTVFQAVYNYYVGR